MNTNKALMFAALFAVVLALAPAVSATSAIANDTLEGLPDAGSDLGTFLSNLAPGVGIFILLLSLFGGIGAIVVAVAQVIRRQVVRR